MYDQLQAIEDRYEELGELLSDPEVISDTKRSIQKKKQTRAKQSKFIVVIKK